MAVIMVTISFPDGSFDNKNGNSANSRDFDQLLTIFEASVMIHNQVRTNILDFEVFEKINHFIDRNLVYPLFEKI